MRNRPPSVLVSFANMLDPERKTLAAADGNSLLTSEISKTKLVKLN